MNPKRAVPVVCAVMLDARGRVLLAQRPPQKHLAGFWEFPGGKVEPGEIAAAALQRELAEELGCQVDSLRPLPPFTHDYGNVLIEMLPFVCRLAPDSPPPHPHEHSALQWVAVPELRHVHLAPADWPIVAQLEAGG